MTDIKVPVHNAKQKVINALQFITRIGWAWNKSGFMKGKGAWRSGDIGIGVISQIICSSLLSFTFWDPSVQLAAHWVSYYRVVSSNRSGAVYLLFVCFCFFRFMFVLFCFLDKNAYDSIYALKSMRYFVLWFCLWLAEVNKKSSCNAP